MSFMFIFVTALQLKCDLLSPYFMDPNGLIPDENFIRSGAKKGEFEVTTLYWLSSEYARALAPRPKGSYECEPCVEWALLRNESELISSTTKHC